MWSSFELSPDAARGQNRCIDRLLGLHLRHSKLAQVLVVRDRAVESDSQPRGRGHIRFSEPDLFVAARWFDDSQVAGDTQPELSKIGEGWPSPLLWKASRHLIYPPWPNKGSPSALQALSFVRTMLSRR